MKIFAIENETNNIIVHSAIEEPGAVANAECFRDQAGLAHLAAAWPTARLVEIWNCLPGVAPVKKFTDRNTAVSRIWKAIQCLGDAAPAAEETAPVIEETAPVAEPLETVPVLGTEAFEDTQTELVISEPLEPAVVMDVAPHALDVAPPGVSTKNNATRVKKAHVAAGNAGALREGSKTSQVIAMLRREGGTTLEEVMSAMGWQKHTTRAMLSVGGSLTKNHGLIVISEKVGDKRVYSIKA